MELESLTIAQLRSLRADIDAILTPRATPSVQEAIPAHPYLEGEAVLIRTVTMIYTGKIVRVTAGELVITDAAWIPDTARWSIMLKTGVFNEVEPYPDGVPVIVPRAPILDVCRWTHPLPRDMK